MPHQENLFARQAEIFGALAHPLRVAIVECLQDGERCVCEIAEQVTSERSNISHHLSLMVRAGVLSSRKQGLQVFYRLRCKCIAKFISCVEGVLREQLVETEALLRHVTERMEAPAK